MLLADPGLDMTGAAFPALYGMLRAFVQSTRVCIGSAADRALLAMIHTGAGRDRTARIVGGAGCGAAQGTDEIAIAATADGLSAATIRIPVSHDVADLPAGGPALPS